MIGNLSPRGNLVGFVESRLASSLESISGLCKIVDCRGCAVGQRLLRTWDVDLGTVA